MVRVDTEVFPQRAQQNHDDIGKKRDNEQRNDKAAVACSEEVFDCDKAKRMDVEDIDVIAFIVRRYREEDLTGLSCLPKKAMQATQNTVSPKPRKRTLLNCFKG